MENTTETQALTTQDMFAPFEAQAKEWMDKASGIVVTDETQVDLIKGAREARIALKTIRVNIENTRKRLKEEYLRKGSEIQGIANRLRDLITPIEEHLQQQEDFIAIQESKRKRELFNERLNKLAEVLPRNEASMMPLADMGEEAFSNMYNGYKLANEAKVKYDLEQKELQERQQKEIEEQSRKDREERIELEKKLAEERRERERLENEKRIQQEKEQAIERERINKERREKRGPDKNKLISFANQIDTIKCLPLSDSEAKKILESANELLLKTKTYILKNAEKL